jgi:hypothetical protein
MALSVSDGALAGIHSFTREAGVRRLDRGSRASAAGSRSVARRPTTSRCG